MKGIQAAAVTIALVASVARAETPSVLSVDDVILDASSLRGKAVTVSGYTACVGQNGSVCMLYDDPSAFTKNIFFNASKMSREDRGRIISCNLLTNCKVILTGIIVNQPLKMLEVTRMDWGDGMSARPKEQEQHKSVNPTGPMSVKDFILDGDEMYGRKVTIQGAAQCNGTSCWLTQAEWSSQQVVAFDASRLPRDDRKKLLECSEAFSSGCAVDVTGEIGVGSQIRAISVVWR